MLNEVLNKSNLNWQLTFHNPATPVMEGLIEFHNYAIMCLILDAVFVVWFLVRSLYLFRASKNSDQFKQNHDPLIETVWVMAPVFVLVAIAMPSFSLLYSMDEVLDPSLVVKVTPHEWFWSYELANSKGNTIQSMFKIQHASSKNSMPVIDISSTGLKINKMLWQIELIFKHILSDFLIINIQNSFLYKVLFKLLSITFRDSPLLEKVALNGFSFITAETKTYFAKLQSRVIAAMSPKFDPNPYLYSRKIFFSLTVTLSLCECQS